MTPKRKAHPSPQDTKVVKKGSKNKFEISGPLTIDDDKTEKK